MDFNQQLTALVLLAIAFTREGQTKESSSQPLAATNHESSLLDGSTDRKDNEDILKPVGYKTMAEEVQQGFLPLPPGYNRLTVPKLKSGQGFMQISTFLSISQITDVDEENGLLELDVVLGMSWLDWEIWYYMLGNVEAQEKLRNEGDKLDLDAQFLKYVWKPDVSIEELASVDTTYLLSKQTSLKLVIRNSSYPGMFYITSRNTLRVRCSMDFTFYPADTQKCALNLHSYSYAREELSIIWDHTKSVYLYETKDPNYEFQVSDVEPGNRLYSLYKIFRHNPSCATCPPDHMFSKLTCTIQIRRNLTYHLVQTFLPSILLILITWLCFLLPQDMVEARIGVSMTTLLTIIAMFASVREHAPKVSYTMAIDVWMVFCIFLIFIALILFTIMYWMRWRYIVKPENLTKVKVSERRAGLRSMKRHGTRKNYARRVARMKRYVFYFFTTVFGAFLILFGIGLFWASEYFSWNPSPKYNAVGEVPGDTNRNQTDWEVPFAPSDSVKVVEGRKLRLGLRSDVVCPRLRELNQTELYARDCVPKKVYNVSATN